jgi:hypothetical protein
MRLLIVLTLKVFLLCNHLAALAAEPDLAPLRHKMLQAVTYTIRVE